MSFMLVCWMLDILRKVMTGRKMLCSWIIAIKKLQDIYIFVNGGRYTIILSSTAFCDCLDMSSLKCFFFCKKHTAQVFFKNVEQSRLYFMLSLLLKVRKETIRQIVINCLDNFYTWLWMQKQKTSSWLVYYYEARIFLSDTL